MRWDNSPSALVALVGTVVLAACSYDYDTPFSAPYFANLDSGATGGNGAGGTVGTGGIGTGGTVGVGGSGGVSGGGGSGNAGGAAGSVADAGPDAPDAGCGPGTKLCDTTCVPDDDPVTGCAGPTCDPCAFDHAAAICTAGACALGACEPGFMDCDTLPPTGCEIDTATDVANCGDCARACSAGFTCGGGACHCAIDPECDTGGGGTCDQVTFLCMCGTDTCETPCSGTGTCPP